MRTVESSVNAVAADVSTFVVMKNDVATSMTCVTTNLATLHDVATCSDVTNTFSMAAGDRIEYRVTQSNAAAGLQYSTTLYCK